MNKATSDIQENNTIKAINDIAKEIGIDGEDLENYGKYIAKVPYTLVDENKVKKSKLILVTAITATKAGIGKTSTAIGLAMGLNKIGKRAVLALREPSLGPYFGMKGGACGGGKAQILPAEKINLHFTGDFHAISTANNLISAFLDNYLYRNRHKGFALKKILWKRVIDLNDRSLRQIVTGLGPEINGLPLQSGFNITPASEIMAILCLSKDIEDLKERIDKILLGYTLDDKEFTVRDLGVTEHIVCLLRDAFNPNLVQSSEGTAAFVHGGPFANIAHGCNSIIATKMAMTYGDYAITEAGFGADLGGEKFFNIKCQIAGLNPALTVLTVSLNGLKMHGGVALEQISKANKDGLIAGLKNLDKHVGNLQSFGQTVLVCLNKYENDSEEELTLLKEHCKQKALAFAICDSFANGGEGAIDFAKKVVDIIANHASEALVYSYSPSQTVLEKIERIAKTIYGASSVQVSEKARKALRLIEKSGYGRFPICIAKTQYSFSQDASQYGVPDGFCFEVNDIEINAGARILIVIAGNILRMPGLA